jgi:hypothetical protein
MPMTTELELDDKVSVPSSRDTRALLQHARYRRAEISSSKWNVGSCSAMPEREKCPIQTLSITLRNTQKWYKEAKRKTDIQIKMETFNAQNEIIGTNSGTGKGSNGRQPNWYGSTYTIPNMVNGAAVRFTVKERYTKCTVLVNFVWKFLFEMGRKPSVTVDTSCV